MELYATIRGESKYRDQQEYDDKNNPIAFKVTLDIDKDPYWPVKGGIGGNYAIFDIDLWIKLEGKLKKLPVHSISR